MLATAPLSSKGEHQVEHQQKTPPGDSTQQQPREPKQETLQTSALRVDPQPGSQSPLSQQSQPHQQQQQRQMQVTSRSTSGVTVCQNCLTSTTPLWRRDENGQIMCNACGLFLKLHGRRRPISLKTDVIKSRNRSRNNVANRRAQTKRRSGSEEPPHQKEHQVSQTPLRAPQQPTKLIHTPQSDTVPKPKTSPGPTHPQAPQSQMHDQGQPSLPQPSARAPMQPVVPSSGSTTPRSSQAAAPHHAHSQPSHPYGQAQTQAVQHESQDGQRQRSSQQPVMNVSAQGVMYPSSPSVAPFGVGYPVPVQQQNGPNNQTLPRSLQNIPQHPLSPQITAVRSSVPANSPPDVMLIRGPMSEQLLPRSPPDSLERIPQLRQAAAAEINAMHSQQSQVAPQGSTQSQPQSQPQSQSQSQAQPQAQPQGQSQPQPQPQVTPQPLPQFQSQMTLQGPMPVPYQTKPDESSLQTKVSELEIVNDLLRRRISDLEYAEIQARKVALDAQETARALWQQLDVLKRSQGQYQPGPQPAQLQSQSQPIQTQTPQPQSQIHSQPQTPQQMPQHLPPSEDRPIKRIRVSDIM